MSLLDWILGSDEHVPLPDTRKANLPRDGAIVCVHGRAGCGKTTLVARSVVEELRRNRRRVALFDPSGDVLARLVSSSAASERIPKDWTAEVKTVDQALSAWAGGLFDAPTPVVVFSRQGSESIEELGQRFLELADHDRARGAVLVVDEAHLLFPLALSPKGRALAVVTLVRNRRQTLLLTCQRPQLLAIVARQNAKHVALHGADSTLYVEAGTREYGDPADFRGALLLEQFEYLYRGPDYKPGTRLEKRSSVRDRVPWL